MSRCVVVLPTYQEAENIRQILTALLQSPVGVDVLVVDDGSPDGTADLAEAVGSHHPGRVIVLRRRGARGLGAAYRAGFVWALAAGYDLVAQIDADGSHPVDTLPELVAGVLAGADVAIGSRYVPGGAVVDWPLSRRVLSRFGNAFARIALDLPQRDVTGAYRVWSRAALTRCRVEASTADGYGFMVEMAGRMRAEELVVREVPITFRDRTAGSSKMSSAIAWEAMRVVLATRRAHRCSESDSGGRVPAAMPVVMSAASTFIP